MEPRSVLERQLQGWARGEHRHLVRRPYNALVQTQLWWLLRRDRRLVPTPTITQSADLTQQVTAIIKTFERPATVARCVASLRASFAGRIIIADDSAKPWRSDDPLVEVLHLPFNSGVTVGRNAALAQVRTPQVLNTDDDVVFSQALNLPTLLDYLGRNPQVDAVAPLMINLPRLYAHDHVGDSLFSPHAPPRVPPGQIIDGYPVRLKTEQTFLARTETLRAVGWDSNLRMVDHTDFFSQACGQLVFVQAQDAGAYHVRTPFDKHYTAYRHDTQADFDYLAKKWSQAAGDPTGGE